MVSINWIGKDEKKRIFEITDNQIQNTFQLIETIRSPINDKVNILPNSTIQNINLMIQNYDSELDWENILALGDNKLVMRALLRNYTDKINLIYFDPPFATGGDFTLKIQIGEGKDYSTLDRKAYSDNWKEGLDAYLRFMNERLLLMKELLADDGSIYVHLDWRVNHYIKLLMDEIFGYDNFRNEIIWSYPAASVQTRRFFIRSFETILFYTKSKDYVFNDDPNIYQEYSDRVKNALKKDEKGTYYYRGGSHNGKKLSQKVYVEKSGIFPRDVWTDVPYVRANTTEYQGFSTQKPERLLKRIILASSRKNDIVADFFCGSGTTLAIAEKLNRRWIGCDLTEHAIKISKKRMLDIFNSNDPFDRSSEFGKNHKPLKILKLKEDTKENEFPIEFLAKEFQNENLKPLKKSTFEIKILKRNNDVAIELIDYSIPYIDLISSDLRENIKKWSDWIDCWSIDFNPQTAHHKIMWISYRTPKNRTLSLVAGPFTFDKTISYKIAVKTIDILGNETVKSYDLTIK